MWQVFVLLLRFKKIKQRKILQLRTYNQGVLIKFNMCNILGSRSLVFTAGFANVRCTLKVWLAYGSAPVVKLQTWCHKLCLAAWRGYRERSRSTRERLVWKSLIISNKEPRVLKASIFGCGNNMLRFQHQFSVTFGIFPSPWESFPAFILEGLGGFSGEFNTVTDDTVQIRNKLEKLVNKASLHQSVSPRTGCQMCKWRQNQRSCIHALTNVIRTKHLFIYFKRQKPAKKTWSNKQKENEVFGNISVILLTALNKKSCCCTCFIEALFILSYTAFFFLSRK